MKKNLEEDRLDFYKRWGRLARPYFRWQIGQFHPFLGKAIGDIGCGIGNFAEFFKGRDLVYVGFEPDPSLAEEFRRSHAGANIRLAASGDICAPAAAAEIKAAGLDTILCINVLEHIEDDRLALFNMVDGICRGGHICIIVPAFMFLYGSLDSLDGHRRRYTKKGMLQMVKGLNVDVVECYYMNLLGALGWFLKARIMKEKRQGDENYLIGHLLVPFMSFAERIVRPPFGLSLVTVLKKRSQGAPV